MLRHGLRGRTEIPCPFCKEGKVECLYTPGVTTERVSKTATFGSTRSIRRTKEKYEIVAGCQKCGRPKKDIKRALREGTPEDRKRKRERVKEVMKLREELRKDRGVTDDPA